MLELHQVSRRFGGLQAVDGVDLKVEAGSIVGLVGRNGAGKTTLFNLIAGRFAPTTGRIHFQGQDITQLPAHQRALLGIGRTFQIPEPLIHLNTLENVMVGAFAHEHSARAAKALAREVLGQAQLLPKAHVPVTELTVPDLRRLEVARALAMRPKLLLLDEVMAGLRPSEVDDAMVLCRSLRDAGITLVIVEHVMYAVMNLCDRVVVLDHGRLIADGTPAEVGANEQVIDVYLGRGHSFNKPTSSTHADATEA